MGLPLEIYDSNSMSLKAADLKKSDGTKIEVQLTISNIELVTFKEDDGRDKDKLVLHFAGKEKTLVLNKTNMTVIRDAYGDDTDDWLGRDLVVYPTVTDMGGKTVDCIRLRAVLATASSDDDIPF